MSLHSDLVCVRNNSLPWFTSQSCLMSHPASYVMTSRSAFIRIIMSLVTFLPQRGSAYDNITFMQHYFGFNILDVSIAVVGAEMTPHGGDTPLTPVTRH